MRLSAEQLESFVDALAADPERWQGLVRRGAQERVYELLWQDADVNAWLICWSEDSDTGFHDHDESAAAIHVVEGHVREDRLRLAGGPATRVLGPSCTFVVEPSAIHRVLHAGRGTAVTIHAYSPPLARTGAYTIGDDGELRRTSLAGEEELRGELAPI
jgi:hypothetical protein